MALSWNLRRIDWLAKQPSCDTLLADRGVRKHVVHDMFAQGTEHCGRYLHVFGAPALSLQPVVKLVLKLFTH